VARQALDDTLGGNGRLLLVAGEPGIGKSRLAEELSGDARARGARVLWGRCWEAGGAPAYWPWVQAMRAYVRERDPAALRVELDSGALEIVQLLPELHELFDDLPRSPSAQSEGARFRLFDATCRFLCTIAADQPLVIVLDDLHAADAPSLLLLRFLAGQLSDSKLFLVGAYRDLEPTSHHLLEPPRWPSS
jgi:predicted ATPase